MDGRPREESGSLSKRRVLDALAEFGLDALEAGLATAYLADLGVETPTNPTLRERTEAVSLAEARSISQAVVGADAPSLGEVLRAFELSVPEADRELNGVYYTPDPIVDYIVGETVTGDDVVCDPACGGGAFLLEATDRIYRRTRKSVVEVLEANVYGVDLLADNVRQSKLLLLLYAASQGEDPLAVDFNVVQADSLRLDWAAEFPERDSQGFDAVVGNPPYVKIQNQSAETKAHLRDAYETVVEGNFNTYIPFVELALDLAGDDGVVGFLTPLNYFTTLTGRRLREYLQENRYVRKIVDFGDILLFEDALTYTAITFLDTRRRTQFEYVRVDEEAAIDALHQQEPITIGYPSLDPEKWRLLDDVAYANVDAIESHRRLDQVADIHTGIATLKDAAYTVTADTDGEYYLAEHEGETYPIEPGICRELVKISSVDDESELAANDRRILFPYREVSTQVSLDMDGHRVEYEIYPPDDLAEEYPRAYDYLEAIEDLLATREKGDGAAYEPWYRYGRKQGIEFTGPRLYTPTYSAGPRFLCHDNEDALFCNGYAVFPRTEDIEVLERVLNSGVMDYYMKHTSKDVQGNYQCYQKNFIRTFSVPEFDDEERTFLRDADDDAVDDFLAEKYGVDLASS